MIKNKIQNLLNIELFKRSECLNTLWCSAILSMTEIIQLNMMTVKEAWLFFLNF